MDFSEKLKGWKTMIWSSFLTGLGLIATFLIGILPLIDGTQIGIFIPPEYTPFIPLILAAIGLVTGALRAITTGPVGAKGEAEPKPNVKAGD